MSGKQKHNHHKKAWDVESESNGGKDHDAHLSNLRPDGHKPFAVAIGKLTGKY
ncbi:MAG: hypothetical protein QGG00_12140 [Verrucomicrobiota bacterium]|nr:hypothetical protein [Verrucomicrobiota bacterium]